jgi:hypothetical protein
MDTNNREKMLIIVTLVMVALAGFWGGKTVLQRTLRNRSQREILQGELDELNGEIKDNNENALRLEEFQERSLPSDTGIASAHYQNWLLKLAETAGFQNTQVAKGTARSIDSGQYTRISFTLRGRGELYKVVRFLHAFYSEDQLNLIRFMNLKPINDSQYLDITITVEAASLPTAEREDTLALGLITPIGDRDIESFQPILERDFFTAYAPPRPEPPGPGPGPELGPEPVAEPSFDTYIHTYYSSHLVIDGEPEAWIDIRPTNEQLRLRTNDEFQLHTTDYTANCTVDRITPEILFVAADGALFGILYGETFGKAIIILNDARYANYAIVEGRPEADIMFTGYDEPYKIHIGDALLMGGYYYKVFNIQPEMIFFREDDSDSLVEYGIPIESYDEISF